jgi:hypothetical protein
VTVDWLENSIKSGQCKYPQDYALNSFFLYRRPLSSHIQKMNLKLTYCLQQYSDPIRHMKSNGLLFDNMLFCLHSSIDSQLITCLKHLIAINGGFYLDSITIATTHVLTDYLFQNDYEDILSSVALTHILRVDWLLDSIYLHKIVSEQDYYHRSFRQKEVHKVKSKNTEGKEDSNSLKTFFANTYKTEASRSRSISLNPASKSSSEEPSPLKSSKVSSIFDGCSFYVESSHRNETELHRLSQ